MATTFKNFLNNDTTNTRTLLHEAIPMTGSIVSGTYITNTETNIKNYAHGMFQSVYDYPYLSSSANHVFDITMGISGSSWLSGSSAGAYGYHAGQVGTLTQPSNTTAVQQDKKLNIYNQMAQMLMGYEPTRGIIRGFDRDGSLSEPNVGLEEVFFVSFARLLTKDEIKKGSFTMALYTGSAVSTPYDPLTIGDYGAANNYRVNSPAGEYGLLLTSSTCPTDQGVGLIFYQAGVVVLTASLFSGDPCTTGVGGGTTPVPNNGIITTGSYFGNATTSSVSIDYAFLSQSISGACDGFRNRLKNISFNNTTELNSTIYFCRANHNEFNYSSNPTYVNQSKIVVKDNTTDLPVSYITTIGLYSADNELLAMAKLSEPLKKDPNTELTLRVRLDY